MDPSFKQAIRQAAIETLETLRSMWLVWVVLLLAILGTVTIVWFFSNFGIGSVYRDIGNGTFP